MLSIDDIDGHRGDDNKTRPLCVLKLVAGVLQAHSHSTLGRTLPVAISRRWVQDLGVWPTFCSSDGIYFKEKRKQKTENRKNCSNERIYQTAWYISLSAKELM
jgi:hypothetical protein